MNFRQEECMNLSERLRQLIEAVTSPTRRFVALEEQTGVKAETWRTWWNRGGKASADLIQAAGQTWPEYAFWLVTGINDFYNGHTNPPISGNKKSPLRERDAAKAFFLKHIEYVQWLESTETSASNYENIKISYWTELSNLAAIRDSQETVLESIEDRERVPRPEAGFI